MAVSLNRFPTYEETLTKSGQTTRAWFTYWLGLGKGQPMGNVAAVTIAASPYTFTSTQGGSLVIQGGTVSLVSFSRDGINNVNTGQTSGMFAVSQGDSLIITYSVAPSVTFIPR